MGQFDTNYIFSRNVKIFKKRNSEIFFLKENKGSDEIFEKIPLVKMESSKLINYPPNMCRIGQDRTMSAVLEKAAKFCNASIWCR